MSNSHWSDKSTPRLKRAHNGSYTELVQMINEAGIDGQWVEAAGGQKQFRSFTGGILNWWPTTKTVTVQGNLKGKQELEALFDMEHAHSLQLSWRF